MKLYLYKISGAENGTDMEVRCINDNITNAKGVAEGVIGLSIKRNIIYFKGTDEELEGPPQANLYAAPLFQTPNFRKPLRVTTLEGEHMVTMDRHLEQLVDISSNINMPPKCTLYKLSDSLQTCDSVVELSNNGVEVELLKEVHCISQASITDSELQRLLRIPDIKVCKSSKGHDLYTAIFVPDESKWGKGPYPLIVEVYGGPHVQRVRNHWATTVNMRAQSFCNRGYLVLMLDNRGSFRRGLKFEGELKHRMGTVEVEDQVTGVKWLVKGLS